MKTINNYFRIASLIICFSILTSACSTAQVSTNGINGDRSLHINISADEIVKADLLIFNVVINAEGSTPAEAYELHKQRETVLAGLLKKYDIQDQNIDYQLMRMNRQYNNRTNTEIINTSQSVSVTFSDTGLYEDIQLTLIENGFNNFNGTFSYSKLDDAKRVAMKAAVARAKEQAELITEAAGTKLGEITRIVYSDYNVIPAQNMRMEGMALSADSSPGMLDFEKSIIVKASVQITYRIQ